MNDDPLVNPAAQVLARGLTCRFSRLPRMTPTVGDLVRRIGRVKHVSRPGPELMRSKKTAGEMLRHITGFYGISAPPFSECAVNINSYYGDFVFFDPTDVGPRVTVLRYDIDSHIRVPSDTSTSGTTVIKEPRVSTPWWAEFLVADGRIALHTISRLHEDVWEPEIPECRDPEPAEENWTKYTDDPCDQSEWEMAVDVGRIVSIFAQGYKRSHRSTPKRRNDSAW